MLIRDLKELYFTVLTQFSLIQLRAQLAGLQALLTTSMSHKATQAAALRAEKYLQRVATESHPADGSPTLEDKKTDCAVMNDVAEPLGKQRRRTIRKQVDRLEALIHKLSESDTVADKAKITEGAIHVEENTENSNPKTRGGWGFWKT
jgi:hypothetical protein